MNTLLVFITYHVFVVDINECDTEGPGTADCESKGGRCINTDGGYMCEFSGMTL